MSQIAKTLLAFAQLAEVRKAADFLADMEVLRREDVVKCCRVFLKKHPEIQASINKISEPPSQDSSK